MEFDPYIADGEQARETLEAIRAALVGIDTGKPVHFRPSGSDWSTAWSSWIQERFLKQIGPYLIEVRNLCGNNAAREVIELERKFSQRLENEEQERSYSLAELVEESTVGARHRPEFDKLIRLGQSDSDSPNRRHFVTLFAARCASHHISLASTLAAYLYFELCGGSTVAGGEIPPPRLMLPLILPAVRQVLDSRPPFTYQVA